MRGETRRSRQARDEEHVVEDPFEGTKEWTIPTVTVQNVLSISFERLLAGIQPYVLERVPEGVLSSPEVMPEVDRLIGRFANVYAYLSVLFSVVGAKAREVKSTDKAEYDQLMSKKEALYRLIQAVELKWRACSRQVTVETESEVDFERPNYGARQERTKTMKGWGAVQ